MIITTGCMGGHIVTGLYMLAIFNYFFRVMDGEPFVDSGLRPFYGHVVLVTQSFYWSFRLVAEIYGSR